MLPLSTIKKHCHPGIPDIDSFMSKKILVVDDEKWIEEIVQEQAKRSGYQTYSFTDPRKALSFVQTDPDIDIAIIDYTMPDMNGYQLAKEIRKVNRNIPIILTTGSSVENMESNPDINKIMQKPVNREDLVNAIKEFIGESV